MTLDTVAAKYFQLCLFVQEFVNYNSGLDSVEYSQSCKVCDLLNANIERYTPIACYTTASLYNVIIIFDTVVTC